jgi:hypothetical protein
MKQIDEIISHINWTTAGEEIGVNEFQSRLEDDTINGKIQVIFSCDGDAWVKVTPDEKQMQQICRFRTFGGGGESERVRAALMILALAIKADNEEHPQRRS